MPIPSTARWPRPRSEDEFEDISVDFLRIRWGDPNAARYGRRRQRQHGVDIVGRSRWAQGKTAGAQCKNVESLTLAMVVAEVDQAKEFPGGLTEFKVVTAADRDAGLQSAVRAHFQAHPAGFDVDVVFWPDIVADVSASDVLVSKYWKGFSTSSDKEWRPPATSHLQASSASGEMRSECSMRWHCGQQFRWPSIRASLLSKSKHSPAEEPSVLWRERLSTNRLRCWTKE